MTNKIIYSVREFREEFLEEITRIAPDYQLKTTLLPNEIDQVAVTIGWDPEMSDQLLSSGNLKWVQSISAGVDYLPLQEYEKHHLLLSNASGIHSQSITDHVLAVLFAYYRGLTQTIPDQEHNQWEKETIRYQSMDGKKLLIVGTGHIGKRLAQVAGQLGFYPIGINTTGHDVDGFEETYPLDKLPDVLSDADVVVNILPLTEKTHHLFNEQLFDHFSKEAVFINVGRGPSVDTDSLIRALNKGQLAYAALDVFEKEPLPQEDPLWTTKNVLITPHIAGMTPDFQKKYMAIFLPNLESFVKNGTLVVNQVNLENGY